MPGASEASLLFVVARDRADLRDLLTREFADEPSVAVMFDRRLGERRRAPREHPAERRRQDRRLHPAPGDSLRGLGWMLVRRQPTGEERL